MVVFQDWGLLDYRQAQRLQRALVERLRGNPQVPDTCLVLEHPPVFTVGRNGDEGHILVDRAVLAAKGIEIIRVERGGEVTYHGPGQLVCYPVVNLRRRRVGVAEFIALLEQAMLETVRSFGLEAGRDSRNHGIWTGGRKLGSVGIAITHSISYHGLALNVHPDLTPFGWIDPCGLDDVAMTSLARELGEPVPVAAVKQVLIEALRCGLSQAGTVADEGQGPRRQKPRWLKKKLPSAPEYERVRRLVDAAGLHTVCREARCPNQFECYGKGTATFLIMGDRCTRNCGFCAVAPGAPSRLDAGEPARVAASVASMGLDFAVVTSVTRDDLADGGAAHFAATIEAIRGRCREIGIEVLIPDFLGDAESLQTVCRARPDVLNHNVETVARRYPAVRPQADYQRSLTLLRRVRDFSPAVVTKSGLMVGIGETRADLLQTMADIREAGCEILTIGQYLQPTRAHLPVQRFVEPEEFDELRTIGLELGFTAVAAGPHVRSSYRAGHLFREARPSPASAV